MFKSEEVYICILYKARQSRQSNHNAMLSIVSRNPTNKALFSLPPPMTSDNGRALSRILPCTLALAGESHQASQGTITMFQQIFITISLNYEERENATCYLRVWTINVYSISRQK